MPRPCKALWMTSLSWPCVNCSPTCTLPVLIYNHVHLLTNQIQYTFSGFNTSYCSPTNWFTSWVHDLPYIQCCIICLRHTNFAGYLFNEMRTNFPLICGPVLYNRTTVTCPMLLFVGQLLSRQTSAGDFIFLALPICSTGTNVVLHSTS